MPPTVPVLAVACIATVPVSEDRPAPVSDPPSTKRFTGPTVLPLAAVPVE